MNSQLVSRIVSGGQTGVDRAALDAAIFLDIPHGGWCPLNRRAEDGTIPDHYQLRETGSINYAVRTKQNVIDSDGTLILFCRMLSKGTDLTRKYAEKAGRPLFCLDLEDYANWDEAKILQSIESITAWLRKENISVLNVAGPRESSHQGIGKQAEQILIKLFETNRAG